MLDPTKIACLTQKSIGPSHKNCGSDRGIGELDAHIHGFDPQNCWLGHIHNKNDWLQPIEPVFETQDFCGWVLRLIGRALDLGTICLGRIHEFVS